MKRPLFYATLFMMFIAVQASVLSEEVVPVMSSEDLQVKITAHIKEFEIPPQEPRFDTIWQFVPGLEGIEFDFELSYQNMLANGVFDPRLMVGNSIPYQDCSSNFRQHRLYRGHENSPYVGLLINVAWGGEELLQMLDILDEYEIQASLFFEGKYAKNNRELVQKAFDRGHLVGNHSYSHPAGWLNLSYEGFLDELEKTNDVLSDVIGEEIVYFAPPGGAFNDATVQAAYDLGMYTVLWTADTIDWRGESASVLIDRIRKRISPGGLILTHPKPETVIALPEIIEHVRSLGLDFRRVDDIISGVHTGQFTSE